VVEENSTNAAQQTQVAVNVTTGTVDLTTARYRKDPGRKSHGGSRTEVKSDIHCRRATIRAVRNRKSWSRRAPPIS